MVLSDHVTVSVTDHVVDHVTFHVTVIASVGVTMVPLNYYSDVGVHVTTFDEVSHVALVCQIMSLLPYLIRG